MELDTDELARYAGAYESSVMTCDLEIDGAGLTMIVAVKPEVLAEAGEEDPDYPPMHLGLLPGDGTRYVVSGGAFAGMQGFFTTDPSGAIDGIDIGGRLFGRVCEVAR
jgi:hypothetical protein